MSIVFKPGIREHVGLLVGLAGGTGSGKTMSAMRMAQGIVGRNKPFAVIDTESGRARHYAPKDGEEPNFVTTFRFDRADLVPPFRPQAYAEAIMEADKLGYPAIIVDSMSHEWAGDGGILDWQEEEFQRMGARDSCKMASWIKPKGDHKRMVQRLLQVKAHLILCFRAEEKLEMSKDANGKLVVGPKITPTGKNGWVPVTEKSLPFELTASFLLTAERPGYPLPIKLQHQHLHLFPLDKPISEESGKGIAAWASGGSAPRTVAPVESPANAVVNRWKKSHPKRAEQSATEYVGEFYVWVQAMTGQTITKASELTEDSITKLEIVLDDIESSVPAQ